MVTRVRVMHVIRLTPIEGHMLNMLRRQFPGLPATRGQAYSRLAVMAIVIVAGALAILIEPALRALALEALFIQFVAAGLLWFESISENEKMNAVAGWLEENRRGPQTLGERILY